MRSGNGSYSIAMANESDAAEIASLYKHVWNEYLGVFPSELVNARQPSPTQMKELMKNDTYFVGKKCSQIIGVVGCSLKHGACLMMHMAVDKEHRKRGIGSALTKRAIDHTRENGATKVWLDTTPNLEEAITLYEKHGFVKCGHLKEHYWEQDICLYELMIRN